MQKQKSLHSIAEGPIKYPTGLTLSSYQSGALLKGCLWFGLAVGPLKNTPAAEKLIYLAIGRNPVGKGKDREVCLWGILLVLSLAVCEISGVYTKDQFSTENQGLMGECKQCLQAILKGQEAPKGITHRTSQKDMERGHCTFNGT